MVLPIPRHHATRGFARQRVEHGACKLPEPCHLDFRAWRVVNGAANLAAPFSPSLPVTVGENFPHRVTRRCTPSACGDGGATLAPPCRLWPLRASTGVQIVHPRSSRGLAPGDGGGNFPAPLGHGAGGAESARPWVASLCGSCWPLSLWISLHIVPQLRRQILDVVVARSYLISMTSTQRTTTTTTEPPPTDAAEPLGARLARRSREAQGLPPVIVDQRVREQLQALCALPKTRGHQARQTNSTR